MPRQRGHLVAARVGRAAPEAVDAGRADDGGADGGVLRGGGEDDLVDGAVPGLLGEGGDFGDGGDVVVNFGRGLAEEAELLVVDQEDGGARGVDVEARG